MKIKYLRFKNLILVAIFALMSGSAWAYDFVVHYENVSIDDVNYTYDIYYSIIDAENHYVAVVNNGSYQTYGGADKERMIVPETVTHNDVTYTVTAIGNSAFDTRGSYIDNHRLEKVVLPGTITSIGNSAFYYCIYLTTMDIPSAVTSIGEAAFRSCDVLDGVILPEGITTINPTTFYGCSALTTIIIPNAVTSIGNYAFYACKHLTTVTFGTGLLSIGSNAFCGCSQLTSVSITNGTIGSHAFESCTNLNTLNIGAGVSAINNQAFNVCSGLTTVNIPNATIGTEAFRCCYNLATVTIGEGVTSIGTKAFDQCNALATINYNAANCTSTGFAYSGRDCTINIGSTVQTLPNSVFSGFARLSILNFTASSQAINIDAYAFRNCTGLTSISFGDRSYEIGSNAFEGCTGLTSLTIPSGVTKIRQSAFKDCSNLATIYYNATNCLIEGASSGFSSACAWYGIPACTLIIGDNVTILRSSAFRFFTGLTNLTIGAGVVNIGDYAFAGCSNLASVTYNATSCTTVSYNIWDGCTHPCTLIIGSGVVSLPNSSSNSSYGIFKGFTGLSEITIPSNVTSIGDYTFADCTGLATINFNAPSCTIGGNYSNLCWNGCTHECTLNIGDNVSGLSDRAFSGLTGLKTINFGSHETFSISEKAFNGTGLTELVIPDFVTSIGEEAFSGCSSLTTLTIGTGVTTIGNWAFNSCNHLTTVNYNATNCTLAGDQSWPTFDNCGNGTNCTLTIGNNVTRLPQRIFYRFSGLTSFSIGTGLGSISEYAFVNCTGLTSITIPNNVTSIGSSAFAHCTSVTTLDLGTGVQTIGTLAFDECSGLTSLTIPASVTLIDAANWGGNGAFRNCSNLEEIWFEGTTYPDFEAHAFDGVTSTIPVYVPRGCNYPTTGAWAYFSNYIPYSRFVGGSGETGTKWDVSGNWAYGTPESTDAALVEAVAIVPNECNAEARHIAFKGGSYIIIEDGGLLNCNSIATQNVGSITLRDGGQLVCNTAVQGTVQKYIASYTNADDGWNLIASPVTEELVANDVSGLLPSDATDYDLYYLDVANNMWRNFKPGGNSPYSGFNIEHNKGYLYARESQTTVSFSGTLQQDVAEGVSENLSNEGQGWNLVGNPFTFNAFANKPYCVIDGRTVTVYEGSDPIAPCAGIIVKATGTEETVTFRRTAFAESVNNGNIQMSLLQSNTRDAKTIDNAIVSFNEGEGMPKFNLMEQDAKLYIPQNGMDYAIVYSEEQGVMPLNFEANEIGEYTITVNTENANMSYLHLIDNLIGADIDLLVEPSYTFEAKVSDYASRFRLVFISNTVLEDENGDDSFAFFSNGQLVIANQGRATLQVVDLTGRILSSETIDGSVSKTINATPGIYMLRLVNGDDVKVQKIVVR